MIISSKDYVKSDSSPKPLSTLTVNLDQFNSQVAEDFLEFTQYSHEFQQYPIKHVAEVQFQINHSDCTTTFRNNLSVVNDENQQSQKCS